MLKAMRNKMGGGRGDRQSLLGGDSSDDGGMGGGLSDGLSASQLRDQVNGARTAGRSAAAQGSAIGATRRQDALGGVKDMGMAGLEMGLDVAVPGLGYGIGAASSAASISEARYQGDSMGAASVGEGARTAAGFIPVIGEFVGFLDGMVKVGVASFQSDAGRTNDKLAQARQILAHAETWQSRLPALREEVIASGDQTQLGRLNKAEQRLQESVQKTEAWIAKKGKKGTMPLMGDPRSGSSSSDAE